MRAYLLPLALSGLALVMFCMALADGASLARVDLGCMTDMECEAEFGPDPAEEAPVSSLPPALTE